MDPLTTLAFQLVDITPQDLVHIVLSSEQSQALQGAKDSYLAAVRVVANQVVPAP